MSQARTNPWLVLLVLTTGFFMILLDTTIVNVAIPAMSTGLNSTFDQILWVINDYVLVYAVLLITAGRLGDLYGQRSLFAIGLAIFTVASALCGFSQNAGELIAARILQGVGGALLTPQTLAILTSIFPPERRGAAFGVWGGVAGLATLAGPTVGGALITYIDWRWIFFINVPIGVQSARGFSAMVAGLTMAPMSLTSMFTAPFAGRFADRIGGKYILLTGIVLFTIGMASLAFVAGPDSTWINFLVPAIVAGAGIGMTFRPMTTSAMRYIQPRIAGSASAVLTTIRPLGPVIGRAVIGALLQNQLATTLHDQAASQAAKLPASFRDQFIATFSNVSSKGFEIGTGQTGARLPGNIPPAVAQQLSVIAHDVFVNGYIDAMKRTFVLPIVFLAFTALTTLLIKRRARQAAVEQPAEEVRAAAS